MKIQIDLSLQEIVEVLKGFFVPKKPIMPKLEIREPAAKEPDKKPPQRKTSTAIPATPKKTAPSSKKTKPAKKTKEVEKKAISLSDIKAVDLSDCKTIPQVIDKIQLETDVSGNKLAQLIGLTASEISVCRKGKIYPYVERAFAQHLNFPPAKNTGGDLTDSAAKLNIIKSGN